MEIGVRAQEAQEALLAHEGESLTLLEVAALLKPFAGHHFDGHRWEPNPIWGPQGWATIYEGRGLLVRQEDARFLVCAPAAELTARAQAAAEPRPRSRQSPLGE